MSAKTLLRYAEHEVRKLKRDTNPELTTLDIVLVFDRSEEEMKRLVGYDDFAKALEELGGEHTEENILQACEVSHLSRDSVYFEDMEQENSEQHEDIHLHIPCTVSQAKRTMQNSIFTEHKQRRS